ncbi:PaaX family transcriptional regulator C-terminal domain-containing protein [Pseudophaeobacter sp. EL27]|uniref:PaaX family transcriptional regulator C-terminal domain-containing protein n=1 Tax=Pseudophaeobacter sp. EL27 TaxID=2107580 RepID=UPI000EFCCEB7|nr:PaaX family transcriptional regulator C-terminal domain-containing protein [Pseudophaeobacter sp. EL27]
MTALSSQTFEASIAQLTDLQNLRVWSIIVSLFGDLAQIPGDQISGTTLTQIITPMGIKPEAIRVALHRLRKDGWIESTRSGRASVHYLTEFGRKQSTAVTPRIYARTPQPPELWHLLIAEDGSGQTVLEETLLLPQYTQVNRRTALGYGPAPKGLDDLFVASVSDLSVPGWLQARLFPQDLVEACQSLLEALNNIALPEPGLAPVQVATLRTLIVHHWRRIALRHPVLPVSFAPDAWAGEACRARVFQLLDRLPQPQLQALESPPSA